MYIWDHGKLSRIGDSHQESRKFRTDEVGSEMPVSIPRKLEGAVSMLGGQVDQGKGKEIN